MLSAEEWWGIMALYGEQVWPAQVVFTLWALQQPYLLALSHKLHSRKLGWQGSVIRRQHLRFSKHRMMRFEVFCKRAVC